MRNTFKIMILIMMMLLFIVVHSDSYYKLSQLMIEMFCYMNTLFHLLIILLLYYKIMDQTGATDLYEQ